MIVSKRQSRTVFATSPLRFPTALRLLAFVVAIIATTSTVIAQPVSETLSPPDEITRRYWDILQRNPRPGTAFDQWYSGHVDRGEIEALTNTLQKQALAKPDDTNTQILLGLVLRRQGELESAAKAFERAATSASDNYYPQLLLGQTLQQAQKYEASATSLSTAIALAAKSRIPRPELLNLYRGLGHAQQLAGDAEAAIGTWTRLGKLFPDDERVQTQIATWFQNDNRWPEALAAWKRVEQLAKDPYAKLESRLAMSDAHNELNDRETAISILDQALNDAKPGSSLDKDIRQRLRSIYANDTNALIKFLQQRVARRADELGSIVQLSDALNSNSRHAEAVTLLSDIIVQAPKQNSLREALVETFRRMDKFEQACEQAGILVRQNPKDVDYLRLAGQLRLDGSKTPPPNAVVDEVIDLWQRIPATRPNDASLAIRAADLFSQAAGVSQTIGSDALGAATQKRLAGNRFVDAAERNYRQAIQVANDPVAYYEYLAQFLRDTGRPQQAIAALNEMVPVDASGEQLYQVAQIFRRLRYPDEALKAAKAAIAESPDNPIYRELCVSLCRAQKKYVEALSHLDAAVAQLEKNRDIALALQTRVEILLEGQLLPGEERRISQRARVNPTWQDLWQLGLAYKSQNDSPRARASLDQALALLPNEPTLIATSAEVDVVSGNADSGIRKYEQLAALEPHLRAAHLRRVVELHIGQNSKADAKLAAERLFAKPANRANDYIERASVAKMIDDAELESRMLRRAVQIEPRNVEARMALGMNLAEKNETSEALENYWRAFELVEGANEKGALLRTMHDVDENIFARRIMPRLENIQKTGASNREASLSLADAYVASRDLENASRVLESLLKSNPHDPQAIRRIASIELDRGQPLIAANYLEQLAAVSESVHVWRQLLRAYESAGQVTECVRVATKLASDFGQSSVFTELTDRVPIQQSVTAQKFARAGIELNPNDWRLRIRLAMMKTESNERATEMAKSLRACLNDPKLVEAAEKQVEATAKLATARPPRNLTAKTLGQSQIRAVLNATFFPVFQEFNNARSNADRYTRLQQLIRARAKRAPSRKTRINRGMLIPNDPYNAAVYCHQALLKEFGKDRAKLPGDQPDWIRLRIEVVSLAASEQVWNNLDQLERYASLRPNDLLPHIAKFYESIPNASLDEQAAVNIRSLNASYAWLEANHADLAHDLSAQHAQQLVTAKKFDDAAAVLAAKVDKAKTLRTLVELAPTCMQVDSPAFRETFLTRALELSKAPDSIPEDLADVLMVAFDEPLREFKATEWVAVLALLEKHLKAPLQSGRSRSVTSPKTFQTSGAMSRQVSRELAAALRNPALSSGQRRALIQAAQRQKLQSARIRRSRPGRDTDKTSTDKIVTSNNPHLSPQQCDVLMRAIDQAQTSGDELLLLNWLSKKAAAPSASTTQQVAEPFALWVAGQRETAADGFAKLSKAYPKDVNLRLLAASAAFEVDKLDKSFVMLSDKSLQGSRVESDTILLQSQINSSLTSLTDYDVGLRCLVAAMEHQTVPYLYPFFARHKHSNITTTLPAQNDTAAGEEAASGSKWLLSGKPHHAAVILGILDHAWQLDNGMAHRRPTPGNAPGDSVLAAPKTIGNLQRIEALVETNLTLHSNNQELIALRILLDLRNGKNELAKKRVDNLQRSNDVEHWTSPTTAELASVLVKIPTTADMGYDLASNYIIGNVARGATQRGTDLLKDVTYTISDRRNLGDRNVGKPFWESYFRSLSDQCLAKSPSFREETVVESVKAIYEASHDTIPSALTRVAEFSNGPLGIHLRPDLIGPILFSTIRNANLHWLNSERRAALDALIDLTFPDGLQGRCQMWNWYQFPNSESALHRYSLGEPILRIAAETQQLAKIRNQLNESPHSETPQIVALRLEIAKLDEDLAVMIPLAVATNKRVNIDNPPVWSLDLVAQLDPDLETLGTIIRASGTATLKTGDEAIVARSLSLPTSPFHITEINLESPVLKRKNEESFDLASLNLGRLKQLQHINLTNAPFTDNDVERLQSVRQLTVLNLDGTEITDAGLRQLSKIRTLRKLSVRGTKVSEKGLVDFRELHPDCEITFVSESD